MQKYFNYTLNKLADKYKIKSILVAISGGQDSICLIKLLESFDKLYNLYKIEYIYIDHQWRIDSKKQIQHIISYMKVFKKKIYIYQINQLNSSEHVSRKHRYHIIINHAAINRHEAIVTAHTKTDKLETFLLNLTRGTSLEGATSLSFHRKLNYNLNLFRPLISTSREDITFFCKKRFLPLWSDTTNYNYEIKRNRIRHEILPYLRKYLNNRYASHFIKFLKTCHYDNEYIKQKVNKLYIYLRSDYYISINFYLLKKEPFSIQARMLQLFIYHNFHLVANKKTLLKIIKYINTNNKEYRAADINNAINIRLCQNWMYVILKI
uniref:tRNA(Ile)-lysidine synthase, chloroplastic n=1 Tax=Caloglossa intermedia TaxID=100879 RepID=A0A1Z1M6A5_9FLOR|nr:tRNA Ile-lysidine synthetase [Caloglossa intermedia]ARW61393.1 tRNA Ile-lysidine synthetase [Caloglossa intermedia]